MNSLIRYSTKVLSVKSFDKSVNFLYLLLTFYILLAACKKDDEATPVPVTLSANAGNDLEIITGKLYTLNGSSSQSGNGKPMEYFWTIKSKPATSKSVLAKENTVAPTFTPDLPGKYIIQLKVSQGSASIVDEVILTAKEEVTQSGPEVISTEISVDRVLENINTDPSSPDYIISSTVIVKAKLTIKPGVIIAFESNSGLIIYPTGSIIAKGAANEQIIFTGKNKMKGFWKGILFESNNNSNELDFVTLEYAGSSRYEEIPGDVKASIVLDGTDVSGSALKFTNSKITDSNGHGMFVEGKARFNGFSNNHFSNNTGVAITIPTHLVSSMDAATKFTDHNGFDGVETGGTFNESTQATWPAFADGSSYLISRDLIVESGLRIAEGAILKMQRGVLIEVKGNGYLNISGSDTDRITLTSYSNIPNDYWTGILYNTNNPLNKIINADVYQAGLEDMPGFASLQANIAVSSIGKVQIEKSKIRGGLGWGIIAMKDKGSQINDDVATANSFFNLPSGNLKLYTIDPSETTTLPGEWADEWTFKKGYAIYNNFYNKTSGIWFGGASDPWKLSPASGYGIKIDDNGNFVWTILQTSPFTGCINYNAEYITGTLASSADHIKFTQDYWKSKFYNSCDASQNGDLEVETGEVDLRYQIYQETEQSSGNKYWVLKIFNPDNSFFLYYKR